MTSLSTEIAVGTFTWPSSDREFAARTVPPINTNPDPTANDTWYEEKQYHDPTQPSNTKDKQNTKKIWLSRYRDFDGKVRNPILDDKGVN